MLCSISIATKVKKINKYFKSLIRQITKSVVELVSMVRISSRAYTKEYFFYQCLEFLFSSNSKHSKLNAF